MSGLLFEKKRWEKCSRIESTVSRDVNFAHKALDSQSPQLDIVEFVSRGLV
jgi:hypothetical protein